MNPVLRITHVELRLSNTPELVRHFGRRVVADGGTCEPMPGEPGCLRLVTDTRDVDLINAMVRRHTTMPDPGPMIARRVEADGYDPERLNKVFRQPADVVHYWEAGNQQAPLEFLAEQVRRRAEGFDWKRAFQRWALQDAAETAARQSGALEAEIAELRESIVAEAVRMLDDISGYGKLRILASRYRDRLALAGLLPEEDAAEQDLPGLRP